MCDLGADVKDVSFASDEKLGVQAIRFEGDNNLPIAEIKCPNLIVRTYTSLGMQPGERLIGCYGYTLSSKIVSLGFIVWQPYLLNSKL